MHKKWESVYEFGKIAFRELNLCRLSLQSHSALMLVKQKDFFFVTLKVGN